MHNKIHKYNHELIKLAKKLRRSLTYGEARLWKNIQRKQILGYDFHRQKVIGKYIVDFYCPELRLAIEVDGGSHDEFKYDKDQIRQKKLELQGISVLRFTEKDVLTSINSVLSTIENWITSNANPFRAGYSTPSPGKDE